MKRLLILAALMAHMFVVLTRMLAATPAQTEQVKIIANLSVRTSEISRDELARIFLITKSTVDSGLHVEPVLETSGSTHERFLRQYVGKTEEALTIYYRSLVFAGKTLFPKRFKSDEEVVRYVARTKGAIGYVNSATDTSGTKTLKVQ